jgi:hypothetical protein
LEEKHIHIVSFDIPFPADYGGVIDVFYKIKALVEAGVKIHLHCFQYGRKPSFLLESLCHKVYYYPRKKIYRGMVSRVPYIVGSRINPELLERLSVDQHPILFEGLHTCAYLDHPFLKEKKKGVRMHNVEWQYYKGLHDQSSDPFKSIYYAVESRRLLRFESVLVHANFIFAISKTETEYLKNRFPQTRLLFPFHGNKTVESKPGKGHFMLYHGNLSVPENEEAVIWLMENLKTNEEFPLVVAGKKPTARLSSMAAECPWIKVLENPATEEMERLLDEAQIHILPTFQSTGVKLKLIQSLFAGRFVLVNKMMTAGTGLEKLCQVFENREELNRKVSELRNMEFSETEISARREWLRDFDDKRGAECIIEAFFPG